MLSSHAEFTCLGHMLSSHAGVTCWVHMLRCFFRPDSSSITNCRSCCPHIVSSLNCNTIYLPLRFIMPGIAEGLSHGRGLTDKAANGSGSKSGAGSGNRSRVRVVAFDRVPFGFSARPSSWDEAEEAGNPYTVDAGGWVDAGGISVSGKMTVHSSLWLGKGSGKVLIGFIFPAPTLDDNQPHNRCGGVHGGGPRPGLGPEGRPRRTLCGRGRGGKGCRKVSSWV